MKKVKEPVTVADVRTRTANPKAYYPARLSTPPHADCVMEVELECECGLAPQVYKKIKEQMAAAAKSGYRPTLVDCREYAAEALARTCGPRWESQFSLYRGGSHIGIGTMERTDPHGHPDRVIIIAEDYRRSHP